MSSKKTETWKLYFYSSPISRYDFLQPVKAFRPTSMLFTTICLTSIACEFMMVTVLMLVTFLVALKISNIRHQRRSTPTLLKNLEKLSRKSWWRSCCALQFHMWAHHKKYEKILKNIQLAKNRMRLPDEYFIERSVGDLKIPILCPENCNQSGASISAKMLVSWLKESFAFRLYFTKQFITLHFKHYLDEFS